MNKEKTLIICIIKTKNKILVIIDTKSDHINYIYIYFFFKAQKASLVRR